MKLSVIIPAYNADKYIEQCLKSVIAQQMEQLEIVIINDGSIDMTGEICEKYSQEYSCIKYIETKHEGVSSARNKGIDVAGGEWITFLDADDMFYQNLILAYKHFCTNADVILCNYARKENNGSYKDEVIEGKEVSARTLCNAILNLPRYYAEIKSVGYYIDGTNNWTCWGKFYKRSFLIENDIRFQESLVCEEDLFFLYEVYLRANTVVYLPIEIYFYRKNIESISLSFNYKLLDNTRNVLELFRTKYLSDCNVDFQYFIVNRIIACCILYFASSKNSMDKSEKKNKLNNMCEVFYIKRAIKKCSIWRLAVGKKLKYKYLLILFCLKLKFYNCAFLVAKYVI